MGVRTMVEVLQIAAVLLAAWAWAPALAHALELPGKRRLTKDAYLATQGIYYPGFTVAGIGEPIAAIAALGLLSATPREQPEYWLTLIALVGLIGMQAVYWIVTHPINKVWAARESLGKAGSTFFAAGAARTPDSAGWQRLRDRWEYSHVARAILAAISLIGLVIALNGAAR
jgi:uncharacterized membrane protein